jgi:hypothetical protein
VTPLENLLGRFSAAAVLSARCAHQTSQGSSQKPLFARQSMTHELTMKSPEST